MNKDALVADPAFLAVIDRIIPADSQFAAASANGVPGYLRHQLRPGGDLERALPIYRLWLDALQRESRLLAHDRFEKITAKEQDALLRRIEQGHTAACWPVDASEVFAQLVEHVAEGYYADPEHNPGANPAKASWRMIGFAEHAGLPAVAEASP